MNNNIYKNKIMLKCLSTYILTIIVAMVFILLFQSNNKDNNNYKYINTLSKIQENNLYKYANNKNKYNNKKAIVISKININTSRYINNYNTDYWDNLVINTDNNTNNNIQNTDNNTNNNIQNTDNNKENNTDTDCVNKNNSILLTTEEKILLSKVIYLEGNTESHNCKLAIVSCIFNRIDSGKWGNSLKEVLYSCGHTLA